MGLRNAIQNAAAAAVNATGSIAVSTTYEAYVTTAYSVTAGTNTTTYSTRAGVSVIFGEFRIEQIDGQNIQTGDKIASIAAKHISGVIPDVNDRIIHGGQAWNVQRAGTDPAEALWELQVRKP